VKAHSNPVPRTISSPVVKPLGVNASHANADGPPVVNTPTDVRALYRSLSVLADALKGTLDALQAHQLSPASSLSLVEVINELLVSKVSQGLRHRYLVQLRLSLASLVRSLPAGARCDEVTAGDVEAWLNRPEWGASARRSYLIDARTLFSFAEARGFVRASPAKLVPVPRVDRPAPGIHSPDQVAQILATARDMDRDVMRMLAIQYFAGLRPAEARRIGEGAIREGYVVVDSTESKTRQRRLVTIRPALSAWLAEGGELPVLNLARRYYRVRTAAGVPWSHDVTRHSFVSYHLAAFDSAAKTSAEAGHSEAVLFRHYRALVTSEDAGAFWAIRPLGARG